MIALKKAEKDDAYVARLFNPTGKEASCRFISENLTIDETIGFTPFELKTFRLAESSLTEWALIENTTEN